MLRILLVSPYHALSHAVLCDGLVANLPQHHWRVVSMSPRHFSWRVRGSGISLRETLRAFEKDEKFDLILATSMLDLSTAKSCTPCLRDVPAVLYFHENQFVYPQRGEADADIQLLSIKSALTAERLVFNSQWNLDSFLSGAHTLLRKMPERGIERLVDELRSKALILPVPLPNDCYPAAEVRPIRRPVCLLWNHRWEFDKGPERFERFLERLEPLYPFELVLCGQQFRNIPDAFSRIAQRYEKVIKHLGFAPDRETYLALLRKADFVVSCATHEFQGLAVQEAMASGCRPLVPDRLSYPAYVPASFRYRSDISNIESEIDSMVDCAASLIKQPDSHGSELRTEVEKLSWRVLAPQYDALVQQTIEQTK